MSLAGWSLKKIQFLLSHVENFVEDGNHEIRERLAGFEVQTGLDKFEALVEPAPSDKQLPLRVFEKLAPFYEAGLLIQSNSESAWALTDFFWRGQIFQLEQATQMDASKVIREISPLQVQRAHARLLFDALGLGFLRVPPGSSGFLFKPSVQTAYILISDLPEIWSADHVQSTQRLLNKSFTL